EIRRGTLAVLAAGAEGARGEITLVVGGFAGGGDPGTPAEWARRVSARVGEGEDRRSAITGVAEECGVPRRSVYDAVVAAKHADDEGPGERK
ncbi:MAG: 16S rRNA (cytidine(1402)-2'-O)-methyltransferase, partial [bacterium]